MRNTFKFGEDGSNQMVDIALLTFLLIKLVIIQSMLFIDRLITREKYDNQSDVQYFVQSYHIPCDDSGYFSYNYFVFWTPLAVHFNYYSISSIDLAEWK